MLSSNELTDLDMLLCGSLLVLRVIHILFVSHKNSKLALAANTTLQETLVLLNSEYATHQSSQPPQTSCITEQLAVTVAHQCMVFVRLYVTGFAQLSADHVDMLMHVTPFTSQQQAVADDIVKEGDSPRMHSTNLEMYFLCILCLQCTDCTILHLLVLFKCFVHADESKLCILVHRILGSLPWYHT